MNSTNDKTYQLHPIGHVQQTEEGCCLMIDEAYRAGLKQLDQFSHVIIFWWADQHDNAEDRRTLEAALPYAPGVTAGVFACRSEYRPNPIAMTISLILDIDMQAGTVVLPWIDAHPGTPVLDLKPYVPISERVRDVKVAPWFEGLPTWMEDAATFDFEAFFNPE